MLFPFLFLNAISSLFSYGRMDGSVIFRYPVFKNNVAGKEKIIILRRESRDFRVLRIPRGFRVLRGPRIVFVSLKDLE